MLPQVISFLSGLGPITDVVDVSSSEAVLVEMVLYILVQFAAVETFQFQRLCAFFVDEDPVYFLSEQSFDFRVFIQQSCEILLLDVVYSCHFSAENIKKGFLVNKKLSGADEGPLR